MKWLKLTWCATNGCHWKTGAIAKTEKNKQVLDKLQVERERGITVKAQTASLFHSHQGQEYLLNLIDTPVSARLSEEEAFKQKFWVENFVWQFHSNMQVFILRQWSQLLVILTSSLNACHCEIVNSSNCFLSSFMAATAMTSEPFVRFDVFHCFTTITENKIDLGSKTVIVNVEYLLFIYCCRHVKKLHISDFNLAALTSNINNYSNIRPKWDMKIGLPILMSIDYTLNFHASLDFGIFPSL